MTKVIRLIVILIQYSNFILICCLLLLSTALSAQTIVNREWVQNTGTPDETIDWQASVLDVNGDILTTSNTVTTGQAANIHTTKISAANGSILWEREYNHTANDKDYGAAITTDASGNVYVAGAGTAANGFFDYIILKYASDGTLLWTVTHNGVSNGHDVPVAIAVDASGNVYVSGGSENGTALVDYCTIKYDSNGNQQWLSHYDYNNLYDAPVALQMDMSGDIVVTGASADNTLNWESATVKYDAATGVETDAARVVQASGIHEPTDFDVDLYGNFYIVGNTTTGGTDYDIRTIKLSPELNIDWVVDYDGAGFEDGATTIDVDDYGNVFVGGYTYDDNGTENALIIEYDEFGTQVDVQVENNAQSRMAIKDVHAKDGGVLVTGGMEKDGTTEMFVRQYDSSRNLVWQHNDENSFGGGSFGGTLLSTGLSNVGAVDDIYVTGTSDDNVLGTSGNTTTSYTTFTRPTDVVTDTDGNPLYMDRMVIVRFHRDAVNTTAVDNTDILHGRAPTFLTAAAITELNTHLSFDMGQAHLIKVFKQLKSTHTTTTSRLGATVPIPDFWTSFVLVLPENAAPLQGDGSTIDVLQVCDDLERAFPTVRYAHPNYVARLSGYTDNNDKCSKEELNESYFKQSSVNDPQYINQVSLHPANASDGAFWDNAHINVEDAWEETTGESFVRTGVLDSGIDASHPDFAYDAAMNTSPVIPDGWDFRVQTDIYNGSGDLVGHGTAMSGIIGAVRDNNIGIAGIAGGDGTNYGTSIYPLTIAYIDEFFIDTYGDLEYIADAITLSALDPASLIDYSFGLHIMNNAWVIEANNADSGATPLDIELIEEAVHFVNRLQVIFVASRGRELDINQPVYPATYHDPWVINVGGSGKDLEYPNSAPPFGRNLDIVAPFSEPLIRTTSNTGGYINSGGCSPASAHVSGVVALLLGYLNDPNSIDSYDNLAPEDVEHILQETADDIEEGVNPDWGIIPGYDERTGYGRINAGEVIKMVQKPQRAVRHYGTWSVTSSTKQIDANVDIDVDVNLTKQYATQLDPFTIIPAGEYTVDIYRINATVPHNLPAGENVFDQWERHSFSNLFGYFYFEDGANRLDPYEQVYLDNANNFDAQLHGYVYNLKYDQAGQFVDYWIPFHIDDYQLAELEYTLLIDTGVLDDVETVTPDEWAVKVIPSPARDMVDISLTIEQPDDMMIALYDIKGRFIQQVLDSKMTAGEHRITQDVSKLSSGVYYFEIRTNDKLAAKKFADSKRLWGIISVPI